jgi:3-oxoacyl-[acyl-carrier protein] reductase
VQKAAEQSGQSKESILSYLKNAQPAKRLGTSKEIASLACYLLSKEASFINGACLSVDGGYTAQ